MRTNLEFKRFIIPRSIAEEGWETLVRRYHNQSQDVSLSEAERNNAKIIEYGLAALVFWKENKQPYYRLYPAVLESLLRLDIYKLINIGISAFPEGISSLEVEYPECYNGIFFFGGEEKEIIPNFVICNLASAFGYLLGASSSYEGIFSIVNQKSTSSMYPEAFNFTTIKNLIKMYEGDDLSDKELRKATGVNIPLIKIIIGLSAIVNNPDIVKPIPLSKDREKYEKTLDPKYIEKARRRGVFGFDVGKDIPTQDDIKRMLHENEEAIAHGRKAPHVRTACLATYWTGRGSTTPKIILRKSCLVNKDLLTKVPQGYYGKD